VSGWFTRRLVPCLRVSVAVLLRVGPPGWLGCSRRLHAHRILETRQVAGRKMFLLPGWLGITQFRVRRFTEDGRGFGGRASAVSSHDRDRCNATKYSFSMRERGSRVCRRQRHLIVCVLPPSLPLRTPRGTQRGRTVSFGHQVSCSASPWTDAEHSWSPSATSSGPRSTRSLLPTLFEQLTEDAQETHKQRSLRNRSPSRHTRGASQAKDEWVAARRRVRTRRRAREAQFRVSRPR